MVWVHVRKVSITTAVVGSGLCASSAFAGNGTHPRTAGSWDDVACATVVNRQDASTLHLTYAIPYEDTDISADEVTDSRRHQMFAWRCPVAYGTFLPNWITLDDVAAAAQKGLVDPATVDPETVLETSTVWVDCWERIVEDDDRRPITFAAAAEGVDWDTSTAMTGTYQVFGYTWEPPFNLWWGRPGYVVVVDAANALTSAAPAAALMTGETIASVGDAVTMHGCVQAMAGSTYALAYGDPSADTWTTLIPPTTAVSGPLMLEFTAPQVLAGKATTVRLEVLDPSSRKTFGDTREQLIVLQGGSTTGDSGESTGATADTSGDDNTSDTGSTDGASTDGASTSDGSTSMFTTTEGEVADDGPMGCSQAHPKLSPWLGGLILLLGRRRRTPSPRIRTSASGRARKLPLLLASAAWLLPVAAWASHDTGIVAVEFTETPCQTLVLRSETSTVTFGYSISDEAPPPLPIEVADARTHQFFALSRDTLKPEGKLPLWITDADVARAVAADPTIYPPPAEDVLEHASAWNNHTLRITPDNPRRPITFAAADEPVDWDITQVPNGTYVLAGYTWQPPRNMWSVATGFVKIVDTEGDLATSAPAIAVESPTTTVAQSNDVVTLTGCASAMEGSTYSVYWASPIDLEFETIASDEPLETGDDGRITLEFVVPSVETNVGKLVAIDLRDPTGRVFRAHMPRALIVMPGTSCSSGTRCDMGNSESGDDEGSTDTGTTNTTSTGGTHDDGASGDDDSADDESADGDSGDDDSADDDSADDGATSNAPTQEPTVGPRGCSQARSSLTPWQGGMLVLLGLGLSRRRRHRRAI